LEKSPGEIWCLAHLFVLTNDARYHRELSRYYDSLDVAFAVGKAAFENRKYNEAVDQFIYLNRRLPQYRRALIYLSAAFAGEGKYQPAQNIYLSAQRIDKDYVFLEQDILEAFRHNVTADWPSRQRQVKKQFGQD
jgi:tetratricopeptide (TPR) repeat protein